MDSLNEIPIILLNQSSYMTLVFRYGYGNWKDISAHIDSKTPEQAKDEYVKHFINGYIGRCTW